MLGRNWGEAIRCHGCAAGRARSPDAALHSFSRTYATTMTASLPLMLASGGARNDLPPCLVRRPRVRVRRRGGRGSAAPLRSRNLSPEEPSCYRRPSRGAENKAKGAARRAPPPRRGICLPAPDLSGRRVDALRADHVRVHVDRGCLGVRASPPRQMPDRSFRRLEVRSPANEVRRP